MYPAERSRLERTWRLVGGLVLFAAAVALAGGVGLLRLVGKERRLARLRAQLLANVSHELKSPVTSMRLFSEMLAEDPLDGARTRRFGKLLWAESLRLSQLIDNLLDFSRLGRKEVELEVGPVGVAEVLGRVAESFGYRAREKGVEFTVDVSSVSEEGKDPAVVVTANAPAVERITLNLLDNALKYGGSDAPAIRLAARRAGGKVEISVADNGPGIPAAERERIFEEFYRARYDDYSVRGSGLGLSLARRLARKMGGDIRVESQAAEGSTFILELPRRE
jgi:signal transduction histidine kinase